MTHIPAKNTPQNQNSNAHNTSANQEQMKPTNPIIAEQSNLLSFTKNPGEKKQVRNPRHAKKVRKTRPANPQAPQRKRQFFNPQTKATAMAIAIGALPAIVIGIITSGVVNRLMTENISQAQLIRTEEMANIFNEFMVNRYRETELIASNLIFTDQQLWQNTTFTQKKAVLDNFQSTLKFYDSIIFLDLTGKPLFQSEPKRKVIIGDSSKQKDNPQEAENPNYSKQESYQNAITTGRIAFNKLTSSPPPERLTIELAVPVKQNDKIIGAIQLNISSGQVYKQFSTYKKYQNNWQLINPQGEVFAAASQEYLNQKVENYLPNFSELRALNQSTVGVQSNPITKAKELVSYIPISSKGEMPDLNIGAMIATNADIAFAPQKQLLSLILLGTLTASLLAGIIAVLMAKQSIQLDATTKSQNNQTIAHKQSYARLEDEFIKISDSYNITVEKLEQIISKVHAIAQKIVITDGKNQAYLQSICEGNEHQIAEISMALAEVQKIARSTHGFTIKAEQAEATNQKTNQAIEIGNDTIHQTKHKTKEIQTKMLATTKKVKRLGASSQKIFQIINLIHNSAEQINLLTLNASINTNNSQIGGRGFAFVADEVRVLAKQSLDATQEIETLVANIQIMINEIVTAIETGTKHLGEETQLIDETYHNLNKLKTASTEINNLFEAIIQEGIEQSQASTTLTGHLTKVTGISEKNSKGATQVSNFSKQLMLVSEELKEVVDNLK